jgi:hypothetical protein
MAPLGKRAMRYFVVAALLRSGQIRREDYCIEEDAQIVPGNAGEVDDAEEERAAEWGRLGNKRRLGRQRKRELAKAPVSEQRRELKKDASWQKVRNTVIGGDDDKKTDSVSEATAELVAESNDILSDDEDKDEERLAAEKAEDPVARLVAVREQWHD